MYNENYLEDNIILLFDYDTEIRELEERKELFLKELKEPIENSIN